MRTLNAGSLKFIGGAVVLTVAAIFVVAVTASVKKALDEKEQKTSE